MSTQMRSIEVDFKVHQAIEAERRSFNESPNTALRRLLNLGPPEQAGREESTLAGFGWTKSGVTLAEGTRIEVRYSEVRVRGSVSAGQLTLEGHKYRTPSAAVTDIIRQRRGKAVNVNGWKHLYVSLADGRWVPIAELKVRTSQASALSNTGAVA